MLSTPSYFKLKSQLRLAAEYDPSTCIEFELRCNSAASNLRYKTVLPHSEYSRSHRVREFTASITVGSRSNANLFTAGSAQPPLACPRTARPAFR